MHPPIYRVTSFAITTPYSRRVRFDDGSEQLINFKPVLHGALFGPLRDLPLFNKVRLDREARTMTWPNGADFDPATLHDWPQHAEELAARVQQWEVAAD